MKSTEQRLSESYCKPTTEEDWRMLGYEKTPRFAIKGERFFFAYKDDDDKWLYRLDFMSCKIRYVRLETEIPVSHFIDLVHDRIAPWRLEEDGFAHATPYVQTKQYYFDFVTVTFDAENVHVTIPDRLGAFGVRKCNVTTYTDLLTLIRLIG